MNTSKWAEVELSGSPTTYGTFAFTVTATDSDGGSGSQHYTLTVHPAIVVSPTIASGLAIGIVGNNYNQTISASGGSGTGFSFTTTDPLDGLTLATDGILSGSPATSGSFPITVTATDSDGGTGTQNYTLVINPVIVISPTTSTGLAIGTVGNAYSQTISASGGSGAGFSFGATGSLDGLTLDPATGILSGMPTADGAFAFTVTATDSDGGTGSHDYSLTVNPPIVVSPTSPAGLAIGTVGNAYSQTITASGGSGSGYQYATTSSLDGLTLSIDGLLSGSTTTNGTFAITVTATDSNGGTGSQTYNLVIHKAIVVSPATVPTATVGNSYSRTITASGGSGTGYTFTTTDPLDGLTLSALGVLGGMPTTSGTFSITVTATDSIGATGSQNYTLTVNPAITVSPTSLPASAVGGAYSQTLIASGGSSSGFSFSTTVGKLPTGMSLSSAGLLSGMARANGSFSFTVTATDSNGATGSRVYSITVASTLGNSANAIYVANVYGLLLHRAPDAGAAGWVSALNQGMAPSTFVADIEASGEYLTNVVSSLYVHYLNRVPDAGGLQAWVSSLQSGATIEQVIEGLVGSPEFFQKEGGGTNAGFVTALYLDILNRKPDAGGYSAWLAVLNGGGSRSAMAAAFLGSLEYQEDLVSSYYQAFLRRPADAGGLTAWAQALQAGVPDQAVLASILGSAEGFADWS